MTLRFLPKVILVTLLFGLFSGSSVLAASDCSASLRAEDIVKGNFRVLAIAHKEKGIKVGDLVQAVSIYFWNGSCGCNFVFDPQTAIIWKDIYAAAFGPKGTEQLIQKIKSVGVCPAAKVTEPHFMTCVKSSIALCKKITNSTWL